MKILFINSVSETLTNPAYSRHTMLIKLLSKIGEVTNLNLFSKQEGFINKIKSFVLSKSRLKKRLLEVDLYSYDAVVLTTIAYPSMKYIKSLCNKNSITLLIDCVEWASKEEKKLGVLSPSYIHNNLINKHLIDSNIKVISISSYLASYFESKNIKTIVIPNLVDVDSLKFEEKENSEKLELLFAGYPQKKDAINIAIEGLLQLNPAEREKVHFVIAGITDDQFYKNNKYLLKQRDTIDSLVTFKGQIPYDDVKELYKKAYFSILVRDNNLRVCNAGFPTKLLDSFKMSTPIIGNITSDVGKYLIDGKNGFVVKEFTADSFAQTISTIIKLFENGLLDINLLSHEAFKTCKESFDYLKYIEKMKELIEQ